MKKLLLSFCMMLASAAAFAQQGNCTLGIHGNYMIDDPNNLGIGANVGYEFLDNVRGVAEFNYFFKKDYTSYWNVELNAEYLFRLGGAFTVYPLVGVDLLGYSVSYDGHSVDDSKLGLNLGGGVEYDVSPSLALKAEYNYKTQWDGGSFLKLGVVIPF